MVRLTYKMAIDPNNKPVLIQSMQKNNYSSGIDTEITPLSERIKWEI